MENIKFPVGLTTLALLVYAALSQFETPIEIMMAFFIAGPFLVGWMVYRVLKDGVPSEREFDEHFYDDNDYRRNVD